MLAVSLRSLVDVDHPGAHVASCKQVDESLGCSFQAVNIVGEMLECPIGQPLRDLPASVLILIGEIEHQETGHADPLVD